MDLLFASGNSSKIAQFKDFFKAVAYICHSLQDLGIEGEEVDSNLTIDEQSLLKAEQVYQHVKSEKRFWVMADKTGLFIDALAGHPGAQSDCWAGPNKTLDEIMDFTLQRLQGVEARSAQFKTSVAIISPRGEKVIVQGCAEGRILTASRGRSQAQMPYSAIFMPDNSRKTYAQMTAAEENAISSRGRAFAEARKLIDNYL